MGKKMRLKSNENMSGCVKRKTNDVGFLKEAMVERGRERGRGDEKVKILTERKGKRNRK